LINLFGTIQVSDYSQVFILKYDPITKLSKYKACSKNFKSDAYISDAMPTPNKGWLISSTQYLHLSPQNFKTAISKIDSLGKEKYWFYIPQLENIQPYGLNATTESAKIFNAPDSNYFLVWTNPRKQTPHYTDVNENASIFIGKLKDYGNSGEVTQIRNIGVLFDGFNNTQYGIADSYQDENGNIFLLMIEMNGRFSALAKISRFGNPIWLRTIECYPNDAYYNETLLKSINPTSDGGFILSGEFRSEPSYLFPNGIQAALIVKTDSCGCFEAEGCNSDCSNTFINSKIEINSLNIYPNPSTDFISLQFNCSSNDMIDFEIYNSIGIQVMKTNTTKLNLDKIDISELSIGAYTVICKTKLGVFYGNFIKT
jgi:hypothetical protein